MKIIKQLTVFAFLAVILTGCLPIPDHITYFEPSVVGGEKYDNNYCQNSTEEYNSTRLEFNKSVLLVETKFYNPYPRYKIVFYFESYEDKFEYDSSLITLKDNISGKTYLPIEREIKSYNRFSDNGLLKNKAINTDKIILTYEITPDSLKYFQIIFPKGSIKLNNKDLSLPTIKFIKKSKSTVVTFSTMNC